jgi:hypothetical protein
MPNAKNTIWPPDAIPVLSRGKHRRPRRGACFMELASYMAGEQWSDHPACTHPALATLARDVNDFTSDDQRTRLAPLVPSVIGLTGTDPLIEVRIAMRAASMALPIAAEHRQRVLAVGILRCDAELAAAGHESDRALREAGRTALETAPLATEWARRFVRTTDWRRPRSRRPYHGIIHHAVRGLAEACVSDPDDRLYRLLDETVEDCRRMMPRHGPASVDRAIVPEQRRPA